MKLLLYASLFFLYSALLAVAIVIAVKKHEQSTSGIVNSDTFTRKFVFKVSMPQDEILSALAMRNVYDDLTCLVDTYQSHIVLSDVNSSREYFYAIHSVDDYSILYLSQIALIGSKSSVPYKVNPFIINKLNAEPVPYAQYADLFMNK